MALQIDPLLVPVLSSRHGLATGKSWYDKALQPNSRCMFEPYVVAMTLATAAAAAAAC